jgi:hypothetical protein
MNPKVRLDLVTINNPNSHNLILGQSHFIKTVEDLHETLVSTVPGIKFGLAFSEASGPRKIRTTGTDQALVKLAADNLLAIACGHVFLIFLGNAFPINVLPALRHVPEIVHFFCATANPVAVVVARSGQGGGIMGVIDGESPTGLEDNQEIKTRIGFLRRIGYKLS